MSTVAERHEMWSRMFDRLGPAVAMLHQLVDRDRVDVVDVRHVLGSEGEACLHQLDVALDIVKAVRSHAAEQAFITAREVETAERLAAFTAAAADPSVAELAALVDSGRTTPGALS